ncbi:MAG: galactose oxidase, partial [Gammaproteobacteria bacterium]
ASNYYNTGGRYDPATDSWQTTATSDAPTGRIGHTAVWTGSEMIVWGGYVWDGYVGINLMSGGIYNPISNNWLSTSQLCVPTERSGHTAVWSGTQMIVWGGYKINTGGAYDLLSDTWHATQYLAAPLPMTSPSGVWTGSQMIIWGADRQSSYPGIGGLFTP